MLSRFSLPLVTNLVLLPPPPGSCWLRPSNHSSSLLADLRWPRPSLVPLPSASLTPDACLSLSPHLAGPSRRLCLSPTPLPTGPRQLCLSPTLLPADHSWLLLGPFPLLASPIQPYLSPTPLPTDHSRLLLGPTPLLAGLWRWSHSLIHLLTNPQSTPRLADLSPTCLLLLSCLPPLPPLSEHPYHRPSLFLALLPLMSQPAPLSHCRHTWPIAPTSSCTYASSSQGELSPCVAGGPGFWVLAFLWTQASCSGVSRSLACLSWVMYCSFIFHTGTWQYRTLVRSGSTRLTTSNGASLTSNLCLNPSSYVLTLVSRSQARHPIY